MQSETNLVLETPRLWLRRLTPADWPDLAEILQNPVVMVAYEGPFTDDMVTDWLQRQLNRYATDGIGLWAMIDKSTGTFLGQCGLTWQDAGALGRVLEIGYLLKQAYWGKGYATEAVVACKAYAFETLNADAVYSIIRDTNAASIRVAERNGMLPVGTMTKHYRGVIMPHILYRADREVSR